MDRCPSCRAKLPASGRCPGLAPLIERGGRHWGIAAQLAHALGNNGDVSEAMVRNYANRDGLTRHRYRRSVYFALDECSGIERAKRVSKEETGKGRPRHAPPALDAAHALAA
jgi:hypothetical protein